MINKKKSRAVRQMKSLWAIALAACDVATVALAQTGSTGVAPKRRNGLTAMRETIAELAPTMQGTVPCDTFTPGEGASVIASHAGEAMLPHFPENSLESLANAKPDIWSERQVFAGTLRHGVSPDGDPCHPVFIRRIHAGFTDQDIADLWEVVRTVSAVGDAAATREVGFPISFTSGLKLWRAVYLEPPQTDALPGRSFPSDTDRKAVATCLLDAMGTGGIPAPAQTPVKTLLAGMDHAQMDAGNGT